MAAFYLTLTPYQGNSATEQDGAAMPPLIAGWHMARISLKGNSTLNDVVWSGSQFVAVGSGESDPTTMAITGKAPILTSPDGVTWSQQESGVVGSLESIIWNGNLFVATGKQEHSSTNPVILTSPDGIKWRQQNTEVIGQKSRIIKIIWSGSQFVAITAGSFKHPASIFASPDGNEWTQRWQASGSEELNDIIWDGGQFVAIGDDHGFKKQSRPSPILTSPDGISWTLQGSGTDVPLKHLVWNGRQLLAIGFKWDYYTNNLTAATALTSPDGKRWQPLAVSGIVTSLSAVTWNGSRYVAVGRNGTIISSADGATWEHHALDRTEDIHAVIATGPQLVAVGSGAYDSQALGAVGNAPILTSPDGIRWISRNSGFIGSLRKVARNKTLFVAVGDEILYADAIAPSVTAPANIKLIADGSAGAPASEKSISEFLDGAKARDNLDGEISKIYHDAPTIFPVGTTTVTFSAIDSAGNVGMATATVTLADTIPPRITPPKSISVAATTPSGTPATESTIAAFLASAAAQDDVDGELETIASDAPETFPVGTTKVTFSVSDAAGNKTTAAANVFVSPYVDTTPPQITPPADITVAVSTAPEIPASHAVVASFLATATAEDDVDGKISIISHDAPQSFPVGATTATFTARDRAGNIATASATIFVEDITAPLLTTPADITVPALDPSGTPATEDAIASFLAAATARDIVDGDITTIEHDAPQSFPVGVTTVTFTASDKAGNEATATASVTIPAYVDTRAPTVTAPATITVAASSPTGASTTDQAIADFLAAATAEDDIDGAITTIANDAPELLPIGETTVTFSASDSAGNSGAATATLHVTPYVDTAAPTFSVPGDITVAAADPSGTPVTDAAIADFLTAATATDDVDGPIAAIEHNAPSIFPIGTTEITFSASDSAGNIGTATANVTVLEHVDTSAPTITPPADIVAAATAPDGTPATDPAIAEFLGSAKAIDDVDGEIGNVTHDAPAIFPVGTTVVTFSASDRSGNSSTAAASVTISEYIDTTPPRVTPPANISVPATRQTGTPATEQEITAFLAGASAEDDADGVIRAIAHDAPKVFPIGSTVVTFSASDTAGHTGTASATVTVRDYEDVTAPLLSPPARLAVAAASPTGTPATDPAIAAFLTGATARDNVDGEIFAISHDAPDTFSVGDTRVTFSARDTAGNIGTISAWVTVQPYADVTAPLVIPPQGLTVRATEPSGIPASDPALTDFLTTATALDDIDGDITAVAHDAPTIFPIGVTTVTFTASDTAGNRGYASAVVEVDAFEPAAEENSALPTPPEEQPQEEPAPTEQPSEEQQPEAQPQEGQMQTEQPQVEQPAAEQPAM